MSTTPDSIDIVARPSDADGMKRARDAQDPADMEHSNPKKSRSSKSNDRVPSNDIFKPSILPENENDKDEAISPKSRGPLRIINRTSSVYSRATDGGLIASNEGRTPLPVHPGAIFANQDGHPIGQKIVYRSSSDADTASDAPSDMVPLLKKSKPKSRDISRRSRQSSKQHKPSAAPSNLSGMSEILRKGSTANYRERHPSENYAGFDAIKPQIETLVTEVLWKNRPLSDFKIKKMNGGSFNRIVAISVSKPKPPPEKTAAQKLKRRLTKLRGKVPQGELDKFSKFATTYDSGEYILRIPRLFRSRQADFDFDADFTMHDFVQDLGIDCPKIVTYDSVAYEDFPYLLQERVPGKSLFQQYGIMNHKQKLQIATQIGVICKKMTSRSHPAYGKLLSLGKPYKAEDGSIARDIKYLEPPWLIKKGGSKTHPVVQILQQGMVHQQKRDYPFGEVPWIKLCTIAQALDSKGAFGKREGSYFTHGDFYPRNIMVDITAEGDAKITAVLDWDQATFQPAVMACRAPAWLWHWDFYVTNPGDEDNLDIVASNMCRTKEEEEIKKAFDDAAGIDFWKIAYHEYAYTARKIVLWTQLGQDNRMGRYWEEWVKVFVNHWGRFEAHFRENGFPDEMTNPLYLPGT